MSTWFAPSDLQLFGETFVTLFVIMDPPGTLPIFLVLTASMQRRQRIRAARQAVVVALLVIITFAVFGQGILGYLHVTLPALKCAGGLLLLLIALELLTGKDELPAGAPATVVMAEPAAVATSATDATPSPLPKAPERPGPAPSAAVNIAFVPLGTPLLAGPGAIVATMVFVQRADRIGQYLAIAVGILAVHLSLYLTMRFAGVLHRLLRPSGVTLVSRVAGLLLSAIAVQLIADAIRAFVTATG